MARYNNSYMDYLSPPPLQLCCIFTILLVFLSFTFYINYESMFEDLIDQLKLALMICPIVLLLLLHWLSSIDGVRQYVPFSIPLPDQDSIHRAGGSPWGVGLLLIFLIYMISYQSSIKERWFPLLAR